MSQYLSGELEENNNDAMHQNVDYIYSVDYDFIEREKQTDGYYIGSFFTVRHSKFDIKYQILDMIVSPQTFFRFPFYDLRLYFYEYSIQSGEMEIIKLFITKNKTNIAIIKTYWLRLVQRHWKKVFSARKAIALRRGSVSAQRAFELRGNYGGSGLNVLPTIWGMLSCYVNK